jgi:hypothetical protein
MAGVLLGAGSFGRVYKVRRDTGCHGGGSGNACCSCGAVLVHHNTHNVLLEHES